MSKFKFSKGPWINNGDEIIDSSGRTRDGADICYFNCESSDENWEANARLIACAPEMLDALMKYKTEICSRCSLQKCERNNECHYVYSIIELIEKATGLTIDEALK